MNEFPADTEMAVDDASSASGDAMRDGADFAELFDIEARLLAFVAPDQFSRLQGTQLVQP
jgi:hypothetical protein